jgi:anti-anti-sigma regulatory factor
VVTSSNGDDDSRRLVLSGEYDLRRRDEVRTLFRALSCSEIDLDFRGVTYVDSSFLSELILLRKRLPECSIVLSGVNSQVKHTFELVDFGSIFCIKD